LTGNNEQSKVCAQTRTATGTNIVQINHSQ